ncbi:MAG: peptide-methionine (S)-S-oxide reductase MsrA [Gemmatimonadaceae bacterium]|nr:peptide-methionine (S)-S-oxide reductase MsrA [Gemmatimonadaceae bacterium]
MTNGATGATPTGLATATLAGGCFWCLEAVFRQLRGVREVKSGYSGGHEPNPTYEQVCTGTTGHAETVRITYDPSVISYGDLLDVYFTIHDPTTVDRQGDDIGPQYRSVVFFETPEEEREARAKIAALEAAHVWDAPIVTSVEKLARFWPAEERHDNYFALNPQNPYCGLVIAPKVAKARKKFLEKLAP